jgi:hypothetical protein
MRAGVVNTEFTTTEDRKLTCSKKTWEFLKTSYKKVTYEAPDNQYITKLNQYAVNLTWF